MAWRCNWTDMPFSGSESCAQPEALNPMVTAATISNLNAVFVLVSFLPAHDTKLWGDLLILTNLPGSRLATGAVATGGQTRSNLTPRHRTSRHSPPCNLFMRLTRSFLLLEHVRGRATCRNASMCEHCCGWDLSDRFGGCPLVSIEGDILCRIMCDG